MSDIDTQIEEIVEELAAACAFSSGMERDDMAKATQAIKTLLIQSKIDELESFWVSLVPDENIAHTAENYAKLNKRADELKEDLKASLKRELT